MQNAECRTQNGEEEQVLIGYGRAYHRRVRSRGGLPVAACGVGLKRAVAVWAILERERVDKAGVYLPCKNCWRAGKKGKDGSHPQPLP